MIPKIFDLTNKVAVVTGAAQGMGRAMSLALAEAGADHVIRPERHHERVILLAERI